MKNITYLTTIIVLLLTSCKNEIPFDVKDNTPKLILNALFDSEKAENDVILALTGREKITYVSDAVVDIYLNGELREQITSPLRYPDDNDQNPPIYTIGGSYGTYRTKLKFSPDDVIRIEARTNDDVHQAWAEVVVPEPIAIEKIDTSTVKKATMWYTDTYLRIRTTFNDNGQGKNYYRIVLEKNMTLLERSQFTGNDTIIKYAWIETPDIREDVVLTDGRPSINDEDDDLGIIAPITNIYSVFDNSRINGAYTMTTSIPHYEYGYNTGGYGGYGGSGPYWPDWENVSLLSIDVKVRLRSISHMEFLYLKALNIYDSGDFDDYFNLPVKFPSNVNGGIGVFGVSTETNKAINLYKYTPVNFP